MIVISDDITTEVTIQRKGKRKMMVEFSFSLQRMVSFLFGLVSWKSLLN